MDISVGFRFYPTDQEIICFLGEKRRNSDFSVPAIFETNVYDFEPDELFRLSRIQSDEKWCSFFGAPSYINAHSKRVKRATKTGYWKSTGPVRKIKAKGSKKVIGLKRILVFHERKSGSKKEIKTNWVMHQFSIEENDLYKEDFVVYRVKKKRDKKRHVSTNVEGQRPKKRRVSTNVEGQQSKKRYVSTNVEGQRPKKCHISTSDEVQPSHRVAFDNGNPIEENISSGSQLLASNCVVSDPRNHVAENSSLESQLHVAENTSRESQLIPSNYSVSDPTYHWAKSTMQVDPQHLANALNGCNGSDRTSFSALKSPINLEQGASYSSASSNDYDVLNSPVGGKGEDSFMNPHVVQDEYPCEDTGHSTLPLAFNSSNSVTRFFSGDISDTDSETFREWVNCLF